MSKNGKTALWVVGGGIGLYLLYQYMQQQQTNNAAQLAQAAGNSTSGIIDSTAQGISSIVGAFQGS